MLTIPSTSPPLQSTSTSILPESDPSNPPKPIGTIRWTPSNGKVARLVVMKDYRQYGFGRLLIEALHDHVATTRVEDERGRVEEKEGKKVIKAKLHSQVRSYL